MRTKTAYSTQRSKFDLLSSRWRYVDEQIALRWARHIKPWLSIHAFIYFEHIVITLTHTQHAFIDPPRPWSIIVITHHEAGCRKAESNAFNFLSRWCCVVISTRVQTSQDVVAFFKSFLWHNTTSEAIPQHFCSYFPFLPSKIRDSSRSSFYLFTSTFRIEIIKRIMRRFPQIFIFSFFVSFFGWKSESGEFSSEYRAAHRLMHFHFLSGGRFTLHFTPKNAWNHPSTITELLRW